MSGIFFEGSSGFFFEQAGKEFKNSQQGRRGQEKEKQNAAEAEDRDEKAFKSKKKRYAFQRQQIAYSAENNQPDADKQEREKFLLPHVGSLGCVGKILTL